MISRKRRVLVCGVGIAGPALAWWLVRRGFAVTLVEQACRPRSGGYMVDFWGIGYDVTERMGLLPRLREFVYPIQEARLVDAHGKRIGALEVEALRSTLDGRFFSILRGDLARVLYDSVADDVEIIFGDSIESIEQQRATSLVRFERAPPRAFDVVIGADGLHSRVRRLVFGAEAQFARHVGYYVASFSTDGYPYRDEHAYVSYTVPGRQIARYSLRGNRTAFLFILAKHKVLPESPQAALAPRATLLSAFGSRAWECMEIARRLEVCDDLYFDEVDQILMPRWSLGPIGLVGDACFCPSLLAGQGASMAMAGAFCELQRDGGDPVAALRNYERRFRPLVEAKQVAARQIGRWFAPRSRWGLSLRNVLTRWMTHPLVMRWTLGRALKDSFELPDYGPSECKVEAKRTVGARV